ncbi:hypothetical protein KXX54_007925 [Aspergillus fumigatus]|nr:hypothetical protein KXX47_008122 [Aspergillus fumigatus]KAH1849136.1 hypothetical protein KXX54_007925 [Aspergillus fumigatus]
MNRQISYNGPLATSSFPVRKSQFGTVPLPCTFPPCNFPSPLPSGPLNHPLPPKPPTSKYFFHAYTPLDLRAPSESTTSPRINRGRCVPVTSEPESPSSDHQIGVLGSINAENIISLPTEDTTQGLESECEMTSSLGSDNADPPRPETILYAQNHDPFGLSEVPESPPSTVKSSGDASVSDKDDDGLMDRCMLHDGAKGLLAVPRSKVQTSSGQVAETSPPQLSRKVIQNATSSSLYIKVERSKPSSRKRPSCIALETDEKASGPRIRARLGAKVQPSLGQVVEKFKRQATQHDTGSSMCIKPESARSKPIRRKRPAGAALETDEKASGPQTRARARAEASEASEASSPLPIARSARPYSAAEDDILQTLVARGLAWEEIEKEFGLRFAKRTMRSLQMRWSRKLKLTAPSTRCSKRKRSSASL